MDPIFVLEFCLLTFFAQFYRDFYLEYENAQKQKEEIKK
jgi:hypothetical protein